MICLLDGRLNYSVVDKYLANMKIEPEDCSGKSDSEIDEIHIMAPEYVTVTDRK